MQVPAHIHGCIAPTFTAFHEDGSLDHQGQRNLLDFMLQAGGISAFFIRSGMGQMYAFDMDDAKQLTRTVCTHLEGKAPVLVGCNGVWERDMSARPERQLFLQQGIELAHAAEEAGAAGVVYTVPEAWVPEGDESIADVFMKYFGAICDAVRLPVYMYQPPNTDPAYLLTPELLARLADLDNMLGVKASYSDGYYVYSLIRAVKDKEFAYICGHEGMYYAALYAGCGAVIGGGSTLNPQVINAIQEAYAAGDRDAALRAQDVTNHLMESCPNSVDFYKRYATEKGFPVKQAYRKYKTNPYGTDPTPCTDAEYAAFKRIYEQALEEYAPAAV